jgi:hypothetical protein
MKPRHDALITGLLCCAGLVAASLFLATPSNAASIPAWLDDAITKWNEKNQASPIRFVDIKDSYVWYTVAATAELGSKEVRDSVYSIAIEHGYANTADEEIVTTGRPPSPGGASKDKKCWTRTFLRDIQQGSSTTGERMLTTLVCADGANWSVGFRVAQ